MKVKITHNPAVDPAHGFEVGKEYEAASVFNLFGHVRVVSRYTGVSVVLEPHEWEEIEDWSDGDRLWAN